MERWLDPTQVEAWLRNWLIGLGKEYGLPLAGRDWEFLALAFVALLGAWIWLWPSRRAFRGSSPVRWLVLGLNLVAIYFWPVWIFAMLLSGIRRSVPKPAGQPRPASAVTLVAAIRKLAEAGKTATVPMPNIGGPWGKAKPATRSAPPAKHAPSASATLAAEKSRAATATLTAAAAVGHTLSHGLGNHRRSVVPNRATWIRRRG